MSKRPIIKMIRTRIFKKIDTSFLFDQYKMNLFNLICE
jgi:hypothetical protein